MLVLLLTAPQIPHARGAGIGSHARGRRDEGQVCAQRIINRDRRRSEMFDIVPFNV